MDDLYFKIIKYSFFPQLFAKSLSYNRIKEYILFAIFIANLFLNSVKQVLSVLLILT